MRSRRQNKQIFNIVPFFLVLFITKVKPILYRSINLIFNYLSGTLDIFGLDEAIGNTISSPQKSLTSSICRDSSIGANQ